MKEIYAWVPYFKELAEKIANEDEHCLFERAQAVHNRWPKLANEGRTGLLDYGPVLIDPFSFLFKVSAHTPDNDKSRMFEAINEVYEMTSKLPFESEDALIFPTGHPTNSFFNGGDSNTSNPVAIWSLFRDAVEGSASIEEREFLESLRIYNVGIKKLTQVLFLVNPDRFLPIDDHTQKLGLFKGIDLNKKGELTLAKYRAGMDDARERFPGLQLYEINVLAYLTSSLPLAFSNRYFQVSTSVFGKDLDHWAAFRGENGVFTDQPDPIQDRLLKETVRGDIVLVGNEKCDGRGIGVVYKNDYEDGIWEEDKRIHVLWLNKEQASLTTDTPITGFSIARRQTIDAFKGTDAYERTFEILKPAAEPKKVEHPLNQILYGPPGTGKTHNTTNHALAIIDGVEFSDFTYDKERFNKLRFELDSGEGQIGLVTFHQNYAYEDFIEGIRPALKGQSERITYELRDGIFKRMVDAARAHPELRFVLIIDEINRGNIAKIFGELITLIEDSRRIGEESETRVTLPYSGDSFVVPANLYLIGTMNTADRSIQLLDTALRRRFEFVEMMPEPNHEGISNDVAGVNCSTLLEAMNKRICALLDREHQIGHTYFFDVKNIADLSSKFQNQVFPLLQEYFFDDWAKIKVVLNNNAFITEERVSGNAESTSDDYQDKEVTIYQRLPYDEAAWRNPAEYLAIYLTAS